MSCSMNKACDMEDANSLCVRVSYEKKGSLIALYKQLKTLFYVINFLTSHISDSLWTFYSKCK